MEVEPFSEDQVGPTMDFASRAAQHFTFNWAGREELLRWKYMEQTTVLPDQPFPAWTVTEGGTVRGFLGSVVSDFRVRGQEQTGAAAMDLYLEEAARGRGAIQELMRLYEQSAHVKLMLISTPKAHGIYLHRGYAELTGLRIQSASWGLVGLARRLRKHVGSAPQADASQKVARLRDWIAAQPGVALLGEEDRPEIDAFVREAQSRYDLASLRGTGWLLWKYRRHPDHHGDVFVLRDQAGPRVVFAFAWRQIKGPPQLALGDLFFRDPDDRESLEILARYARRLVRLTGAYSLTWIDCGSPFSRLLQGQARTRSNSPLCSLLLGKGQQPMPDHRYISAGDGDYLR